MKNIIIIVLLLLTFGCASMQTDKTKTSKKKQVTNCYTQPNVDCAKVQRAVNKLLQKNSSTRNLCIALFYSIKPRSNLDRFTDKTRDGFYFWEKTLNHDRTKNHYNAYYKTLLASNRDTLIRKLINRKAIDYRDLEARPGIGSKVCVMYMYYGRPSTENYTQTQYSTGLRHIYRKRLGITSYYYSNQRGIITAIKN